MPILPDSITEMDLNGRFRAPLTDIQHWPASIKVFSFWPLLSFDEDGDRIGYLHSLDSVRFPDGLESFHLYGAFDAPIECIRLPNSLTELIISTGREFKHSLARLHFPDRLKTFSLVSFQYDLDTSHWRLPPSLTSLTVNLKRGATLKSITNMEHLTNLTECRLPIEWNQEAVDQFKRLPQDGKLEQFTFPHIQYWNEDFDGDVRLPSSSSYRLL